MHAPGEPASLRARPTRLWVAALVGFGAVVTAKTAFVAARTDGIGNPFLLVAGTAALVLLAVGWTVLLRPARRLVALLVVDVVVTLVLVSDLVFHRFYESVIPLPALRLTGELSGVESSIAEALSPWDALYAVDVVVLAALLWWVCRRGRRQPPALADRHGRLAVAVTVSAGAVVAVALTGLVSQAPDAVADRYTTKALSRAVGPLGYHAVDLVASAAGGEAEAVAVEEVARDARRQAAAPAATGPDLTGIAAGANVINIQLEGTQGFLVGRSVNGQEVTPTLNRLAAGEALYWDDFYSQIGQGNTSDAEFAVLNGLYPLPGTSVFMSGQVAAQTSVPELLKAHGWRTAEAFHAYDPTFWNRDVVYPAQGFDAFHSESEYTIDQTVGMGLSDGSFYRQSLDRLTALPEPFVAHVVALSGHHPYVVPPDLQPLDIPEGTYGKKFADYLQAQAYTDRALGAFLDDLEGAGLLDRSLVVVYGDHWGTGWDPADLEAFLDIEDSTDRYSQLLLRRVPFAVRLPGGEHGRTVSGAGGMVDVYPTVVNVLGVPPGSVFTVGRDLLHAHDRVVGIRRYEPQGTFVTDDLVYLASADGRFEEGECVARATDRAVALDDCRPAYDRLQEIFDLSDRLLADDGEALREVNEELARED